MGRFRDARATIHRARELRPVQPGLAYTNARIAAAQGRVDEARAILQAMEPIHGTREVVAYVALREDLIWALDDERRKVLLQLTPDDLDGGQGRLGARDWRRLTGCATNRRLHAPTATRPWPSSMRSRRLGQPRRPGAAHGASGHGAGLRRPHCAEAIAEGERANAIQLAGERVAGPIQPIPPGADLSHGGRAGEGDGPDRGRSLRVPDFFTPAWIRIDPTLAGLRRSTRYPSIIGTGR